MLYEPRCSMADHLYTYVENDWNDYLDHWGLKGDGSDDGLYPVLDELATHLKSCVHSLTVSQALLDAVRKVVEDLGGEELSQEKLVVFLSDLRELPIVHDALNLQLGYEVAGELAPSAEERMPDLLALLSLRDLSERTLAYLDRATRLYLWGFDSECVVMCHSVLEAALEERLPDEEVWSLGISKSNGTYTAYQRIEAAMADGLFTREHKDMAHRLRLARNDILHNAPQSSEPLSARDSVDHLVKLLEAMFP